MEVRRNFKLISTFVAVVIITLLTVATGTILYLYFSGYVQSLQTQTQEQVASGMLNVQKLT